MNVVDLLKDGTALDCLIDAAAANNYGGLITADELMGAIEDEADESAAVLRKVLAAVDGESVVAKAYTKGSNIKVIGLSVHLIDGTPGLFGLPLPKGVAMSKTKEKRGSGDREYTAPIARLSVKNPDDEDEVISLDFDFTKPVGVPSENYSAWCLQCCNANRADLIEQSLIGKWVEPSLNPAMGMERVNLEQILPGKYQVTELTWEERYSKANNPYKVWSLGITAADREFITWNRVLPKCMEVGAVQQRMLDKGKILLLEVKGLRDQSDKYGRPKLNNEGVPYQELDARIYAVDELPALSSLGRTEVATKAAEPAPTAKAKFRTSSLAAPEIEDDEMPF